MADLDDRDGRVRSLALRDLVASALEDPEPVARGLADEDLNVRCLSAYALGVAGARATHDGLERMLSVDSEPVGRVYAAIALGEMGATASLPPLRHRLEGEPHKDVQHQLELAIARIEADGAGSDPRGLFDVLAPTVWRAD